MQVGSITMANAVQRAYDFLHDRPSGCISMRLLNDQLSGSVRRSLQVAGVIIQVHPHYLIHADRLMTWFTAMMLIAEGDA